MRRFAIALFVGAVVLGGASCGSSSIKTSKTTGGDVEPSGPSFGKDGALTLHAQGTNGPTGVVAAPRDRFVVFIAGTPPSWFSSSGHLDDIGGRSTVAHDLQIVDAADKLTEVRGSERGLELARSLRDGHADTTFNHTGTASFNLSPSSRFGLFVDALGVDAQQRVVVLFNQSPPGPNLNTNERRCYLVRFTASGRVDTTFGHAGTQELPAGFLDAQSVAVRSDGVVVLTGRFPERTVALRYTTAGRLDPTFGHDGIVTFDGPNQYPSVLPELPVVLQAGRVIVGIGPSSGTRQPKLVAFDDAGNIDPTFTFTGSAQLPQNWQTTNLAERPDGSLMVFGTIRTDMSGADVPDVLTSARFTRNGMLDTSFHTTGFLTTAFPRSRLASHPLKQGGTSSLGPNFEGAALASDGASITTVWRINGNGGGGEDEPRATADTGVLRVPL